MCKIRIPNTVNKFWRQNELGSMQIWIRNITYFFKCLYSLKQGCGSGSAFIFPPGSRSGSRREIFSKKQKKCKEIGNNCKFVKILSKVNLHKLYCFLLMSILKKALHKVILYTFFTAGSGSVLLDPDSQIWIRIHSPA